MGYEQHIETLRRHQQAMRAKYFTVGSPIDLSLDAAIAALTPAPAGEVVAVPNGWRIHAFTGSFKTSDERWEIYDPEGSGGAVDAADILDTTVCELLDALAVAPQPAPTKPTNADHFCDAECDAAIDRVFAQLDGTGPAPSEDGLKKALLRLGGHGFYVDREKDMLMLAESIAYAQQHRDRVVDDAVVREYVEARNAYEEATRPKTQWSGDTKVSHDSPIVLRYREARAAITAAMGAKP